MIKKAGKTDKRQEKREPENFQEAARNLKKLEAHTLKESQGRAWLLVFFMMGITVLSIIAMLVAVFFRVEPEPTIVEVNNSTGITRVLRSVRDTSDSYDEVISRHFLAEYIFYREGYDWFTISGAYKAINLMSERDAASTYSFQAKAENSPLNIFKDKKRIVTNIVSITFIGEVAQIRFTKQTISSNGYDLDTASKIPYIATVSFSFSNEILMTPRERVLNPLGFKVHSYLAQEEVIE